MTVWAIADLHLSFGVPNKGMEKFGEHWRDHPAKVEAAWRARVGDGDLVLIAGDISWAMRPEEAMADLQWIDRLPGSKVMIRGNHDYWWPSLKRLQAMLPGSIHAIHNTAWRWGDVAIGGTRLWDTAEYRFGQYVEFSGAAPIEGPTGEAPEEQEKIFVRELGRLEMSLQQLDATASVRVAMTHYPPIGADLGPSRASGLLEKYRISHCVFGHLHNVRRDPPLFGSSRGVQYQLTSCDYLDFMPIKVL
jgi:uncharacterized protein